MNPRTVKKRAVLRRRRWINRQTYCAPLYLRRPHAKVRGWDGRNWHNPARVSATQVIEAYGKYVNDLAESYARLLTANLREMGVLPAEMHFSIERSSEPHLTGLRGPSMDLITMDEVTTAFGRDVANGTPTNPTPQS